MTWRRITVHRLGEVPYAQALELQQRLQRARTRNAIPDTLLLLEHPPTFTLGRGAKEHNLLVDRETMRAQGFTVQDIGRGGDVTYHGPGQITGYPILDLKPERADVRRYVTDLEETMIRLAAEYGLDASRVEGMNGTWLGDKKIGAIGVRISRWVTMHGFAFNVNTNLAHFQMIVPCGLANKGVTSIAQELRRPIDMNEVLSHLERHFAEVFDCELVAAEAPPLDGVSADAYAPDPWRDAT